MRNLLKSTIGGLLYTLLLTAYYISVGSSEISDFDQFASEIFCFINGTESHVAPTVNAAFLAMEPIPMIL